MKFSVAALLAAVGATAVDATKLAGKKVFDGRKLLKNAIPVDKDGNRSRLHDNEFEIACCDQSTATNRWLGDVETVEQHRIAGPPAAKQQMAVSERM